MSELCLVTGANGHLGNNLVRELVSGGNRVRASVREVSNTLPFEGVNCEIVLADMLDRASLRRALEHVDVVYHCAAVFRHWAKHPISEIVKTNLDGTQNILEVAAEMDVKKIVYVSSIVALDKSRAPMNELGWNTDFSSPYHHAKTVSERMALELADKLDLWLVSILPAAMIGPHVYGRLTPAMGLINSIMSNDMRVDIGFVQNLVDVRDVAKGMISAAQNGRKGNRYILGNEFPLSTTRIFDIACTLYKNIKQPSLATKEYLLQFAQSLELECIASGKEPSLTTYDVHLMYDADTRLDISAARNELGFTPRPPENAVKEVLSYLAGRNSILSAK